MSGLVLFPVVAAPLTIPEAEVPGARLPIAGKQVALSEGGTVPVGCPLRNPPFPSITA